LSASDFSPSQRWRDQRHTPSRKRWGGILVAILVIASDKKLMQGQPSSRLGWAVVAITTVAMFAAGVAMFVV
jgi:hypothetical protein